jgi:hypothetical protein
LGRLLKSKRRLGTLPSAEDVPSLAEMGRWSSPNRLNQSWQQCGPVGYSAPATLPNYRPLRDESNGTGILSTGSAQKAPFIKPSTLWTILVCPRSYAHALTLDLVDDRSFDRVWSHAGIGRRWHLGLGPRMTLAAPRHHLAVASHRHRLCSRAVLTPTDRRRAHSPRIRSEAVMSDDDDWDFAGTDDAKMTIRAAIRYLLKGTYRRRPR